MGRKTGAKTLARAALGISRTTLRTPGEGAERSEAGVVLDRTKDLKAIVRPRPRL
jgi:hypothetical protein